MKFTRVELYRNREGKRTEKSTVGFRAAQNPEPELEPLA